MNIQLKCHRCKQWKLAIFDGYEKNKQELNKKYLDDKGNVWSSSTECPTCVQERKEKHGRRLKKARQQKQIINGKIARSLRRRLSKVVKRLFLFKSNSAVKDLGCSIDELRIHLESKFQPGMSWTNYGEWHIDHIYPLSKVDLSNKEELLKVIHYTNLQPLWAIDNLRKGNRISEDGSPR